MPFIAWKYRQLAYYDHRSDVPPRTAWKLGGTNLRSQMQFGNELPLFGAIPISAVYESGGRLACTPNTCIELELAVKIPHDTSDGIQYALCFELPQKRLFGSQVDLEEIILDGCGANAIVVQEHFQTVESWGLDNSSFCLTRDSKRLEVNTLENLIAKPLELLFDFLKAAAIQGVNPMPGEIVALGGLGRCFPISPNERYFAQNEVLGSLEVEIS